MEQMYFTDPPRHAFFKNIRFLKSFSEVSVQFFDNYYYRSHKDFKFVF